MKFFDQLNTNKNIIVWYSHAKRETKRPLAITDNYIKVKMYFVNKLLISIFMQKNVCIVFNYNILEIIMIKIARLQ